MLYPPSGWGGYPPQPPQAAWGGYAEPPEEPPPPAIVSGTVGYDRLSRRVVVVPEDATAAEVVEELNSIHGMGVSEKHAVLLDSSAGWEVEEQFAAAINKAFRVKGAKAGAKFWKGVREAVMKQCATQDVLLLISGSGPSEQVQALVKNVLGAADTKAAADSLVGLKSGKVIAVLHGRDAEEVKAWSLLAEDPMPAPPSREELARRNDPDDLSQYYAQSSRGVQAFAPPRQVPPRQRQQFPPAQPGAARYPGAPGGAYAQQQYGGRGAYGRDDGQYGGSGPPYGSYGDQGTSGYGAGPFGQGGYGEASYGPPHGGGMGMGGGGEGMHPGHQQQQGGGMLPPHMMMGGGGPHQQPPTGYGGYGGGMGGGMPPSYDQGMMPPSGQYAGGRGMGGSSGGSQQWGWDGGGMAAPQQQQQFFGGGGGMSAMSMRAADERAAAEMLWSSQMRGSCAGAGAGAGAGGAAGGAPSRMNGGMHGGPSAPAADVYVPSSSSQFGMSANAPSFTPGGGGAVMGGVSMGGAPSRNNSFSLQEASLREAAENLWGRTTSGGAPVPAPVAAPMTAPMTAPPRFTVPSMDRVPSLSAMEAESMRVAAAGLWGQASSATSSPAMAPSMDAARSAPLPSALLACLPTEGGMNGLPTVNGAAGIGALGGLGGGGAGGGGDALGPHCDHLLASLSLDGGSESGYR